MQTMRRAKGRFIISGTGRPFCRILVLTAISLSTSYSAHNPAESDREGCTNEVPLEWSQSFAAGRYVQELQQAWRYFHGGSLESAVSAFRAVGDAKDATAPDITQALLGLGYSFTHGRFQNGEQHAEHYYRRIIDGYADSPLVPWALLGLGNLLFEKSPSLEEADFSGPKVERARPHYQRILDHYPNSGAAPEAALRLASTYFFGVLPEESNQGIHMLEEYLNAYPENPLRRIMYYRLSYWYSGILQDFEKSLHYALKLAEMKLCDPFRWSRHFWHVAETYRLAFGDMENAARWYRAILHHAPNSVHTYTARKRLEAWKAEPQGGGAR